MRRRQAFTIIELLVSLALILFIMVILTEAFTAGIDTFRQLKAVGDMQERLRTATGLLRRDLAADHFEGRRRLGDPNFWQDGNPGLGFFSFTGSPSTQEGADPDFQFVPPAGNFFVAPARATDHVISFTVKLRGNKPDNVFTASVPPPPSSPLLSMDPKLDTTFYAYPPDSRFQDPTLGNVYNSQWAEVTYFLVPNGTFAGSATPLFTLYRSQLVVVPDNRNLNPNPNPPPGQPAAVPITPPQTALGALTAYAQVSCFPVPPQNSQYLYFSSPGDLANSANRAFPARVGMGFTTPDQLGATFVLSDVISFDVRGLASISNVPNPYFQDIGSFDTSTQNPPNFVLKALQISIRIWDLKTQRTRQVTIVQDM